MNKNKIINNLKKEFREVLLSKKLYVNNKIQAVAVLSKESVPTKNNKYVYPDDQENKERIKTAIEAIKLIISKKITKSIKKIDQDDILKFGPNLILNATTQKLPVMKSISTSLNFPIKKIKLIDSGKFGIANTKTQIEMMREYIKSKKINEVGFVSSDYHIPRVARTANKILNKNVHFYIITAHTENNHKKVKENIKEEIKKIIKYSQKGDISENKKTM